VRALTGTTTPDDGEVSLRGTKPASTDPEVLGVLPQSFSPPERLTGREVVAYYAGLYDDARPVADVLSAVGVTDAADTHYGDLSGGEQRRVCLGSTLVNDPEVLFLDEPTTGIDPVGRRTVWDRIEEQVAGGTTVFLTTHDMREAQRLADRVGLLADGDLVAVGEPSALIDEHAGEPSVTVTVDASAPEDTEAANSAAEDAGGPVEAAAEAAVVALEAAGYDASARGEDVHVPGIPARDVGAVADALEDAGVSYSGLAWSEPDLEDVYLALTGEAFEDERGLAESTSVETMPGGESA